MASLANVYCVMCTALLAMFVFRAWNALAAISTSKHRSSYPRAGVYVNLSATIADDSNNRRQKILLNVNNGGEMTLLQKGDSISVIEASVMDDTESTDDSSTLRTLSSKERDYDRIKLADDGSAKRRVMDYPYQVATIVGVFELGRYEEGVTGHAKKKEWNSSYLARYPEKYWVNTLG